MPRSLTIATILDAKIRVHFSWPIAAVVITAAIGYVVRDVYAVDGEILAPYTFAAIVALCLAASVLIHEFAHVLVARRFGIRAHTITLFALGGVAHLDDDGSGTPRTHAAIAAAGPTASLTLGLMIGAYSLLPDLLRDPSTIEYRYASRADLPPIFISRFFIDMALRYIAMANLIIGAFNLLPLFPLDGGRILSAILWKITGDQNRAARTAALIGQLGAAAIILYGAYSLFFGEPPLTALWLIAIGVFLMEAAVTASPPRPAPPQVH